MNTKDECTISRNPKTFFHEELAIEIAASYGGSVCAITEGPLDDKGNTTLAADYHMSSRECQVHMRRKNELTRKRHNTR